jgi:ribosome-associated translation inhibitor RaiA
MKEIDINEIYHYIDFISEIESNDEEELSELISVFDYAIDILERRIENLKDKLNKSE